MIFWGVPVRAPAPLPEGWSPEALSEAMARVERFGVRPSSAEILPGEARAFFPAGDPRGPERAPSCRCGRLAGPEGACRACSESVRIVMEQ